jgi:hypothetical protein
MNLILFPTIAIPRIPYTNVIYCISGIKKGRERKENLHHCCRLVVGEKMANLHTRAIIE